MVNIIVISTKKKKTHIITVEDETLGNFNTKIFW